MMTTKSWVIAVGLMALVLPVSAMAQANNIPAYSQAAPGEKVLSFFGILPDHGVALTTGGTMPLRTGPEGIALFTEPALNNTLALIMKLADENGTVIGFASELEIFPGDPAAAEISWDTAWTLSIPGRGMIFLHQIEHSGGLGPNIVEPTMKSGKDWVGDWTVTTTVGPLPSGRGRIVGGSGEFANIKGSFVEIDRLTGFTVDGVMFGKLEIRMFLE